MLPALFCNPCTTIVDCHTQEFLATSTTSVTSIILHNTPQGLPNRLPCLTSYPPGHVPPIFFPLQRKSTGFHSKANWIYETVTTIISLPPNQSLFPFNEKHVVPSVKCIEFTGAIYTRNSPLKAHLRILIPPIVIYIPVSYTHLTLPTIYSV